MDVLIFIATLCVFILAELYIHGCDRLNGGPKCS